MEDDHQQRGDAAQRGQRSDLVLHGFGGVPAMTAGEGSILRLFAAAGVKSYG
jgi:hypothetical protein